MATIPPFEYNTQPPAKTDLPGYIGYQNTQFKKLTQTIRQLRATAVANVILFGAKGDGITDDTGAFNQALASGATTVYVPAGTYAIATTIVMPSNTTLAGAGMFVSILKSTSTTSAGEILRNQDFTTGDTNIEIRDLGFDGNNATGPSGNVTPPTLAAHGIRLTYVTRARIWRCHLHDQPMEHIALYGNNTTAGINVNVEVADCILSGAGDSAIDVSDLSYAIIHRNVITGFYNTAVNLQPLAQGNPGTVQAVTVSDNTIYDPFTRWTTPGFGYGVIIQAWSNPTFQGIANGVLIEDNMIFNVVEGLGAGGIHIANCRMANNVISQCTQRGVFLYFTPNTGSNPTIRISVADNEILNCSTAGGGYSAIELNSAAQCFVMGNRIQDNQGSPTTAYGIHETGTCTGNYIAQNDIIGMATGPMIVQGAEATQLSGGTFENWGKVTARPLSTTGPTGRYRTTIEHDGTKGYLSAQDDTGPSYMGLTIGNVEITTDGTGNVGLSASGKTTTVLGTLKLTNTATSATGVGTLTNLPAGSSGNPAVYGTLVIGATTYKFPLWT